MSVSLGSFSPMCMCVFTNIITLFLIHGNILRSSLGVILYEPPSLHIMGCYFFFIKSGKKRSVDVSSIMT
jgi:hypothetical protein